jgi:hypothetical protein
LPFPKISKRAAVYFTDLFWPSAGATFVGDRVGALYTRTAAGPAGSADKSVARRDDEKREGTEWETFFNAQIKYPSFFNFSVTEMT